MMPDTAPFGHGRRLLVISHPSVLAVNQAVYLALSELGWELLVVVPSRWRHEYSTRLFSAEVLGGMEGRVLPVSVVLAGRPQRHAYLARPKKILDRFRPSMVYLEQESFSCAAMQWGFAAHRYGLPFGVQSDENLDRRFPLPARAIRSWVLERASFIVARSPTAATMVKEWGAKGRIAVVPHAVPVWSPVVEDRSNVFTIGFAGRLIPEKGLHDLVEAIRRLAGPLRLLVVGNGPLRAELEAIRMANATVEVRSDVPHADMPLAYAEMDVLVLPSRTTPSWAEQFGRVLVEALYCGVPIVGSDSGEIPWVVTTTGGGEVFREGDVDQLALILDELRHSPETRAQLAEQGRSVVHEMFTAAAAARAMASVLDQ
jgi:glycosyltransferase involved in cell wall biosynthesis